MNVKIWRMNTAKEPDAAYFKVNPYDFSEEEEEY
jgi:hypothetical protein